MRSRRWTMLVAAAMLLAACAAPQTPTAPPEPTASPVPPAVPTAVIVEPLPSPTSALPPAQAPAQAPAPAPLPSMCAPEVTANTIINVREGPGTIYMIIGSMNEGETANVDAKNEDGTWWRIIHPSAKDGHGWVAGLVTTSRCIPPSLQIIPASSLPAPYMAAVTNVVVGVDPTEIVIPGCTGESQRLTVGATISASGPMQITYYFEFDDGGSTKPRTLTFNEYGEKQVSENFRPAVEEGRHWVALNIEGLNMQSWQYRATYRIKCG